jgi:hypothetical protein
MVVAEGIFDTKPPNGSGASLDLAFTIANIVGCHEP